MKFIVNGYNFTAKASTFPGGEEYVLLPKGLPRDPAKIDVIADLRSSQNIIQLLMLTEALREYSKFHSTTYQLDLLYLPYARQDRRCARGESFSLKVIANLLNGLEYDQVIVEDCHSDVGLALVNNVIPRSQLQCLHSVVRAHNLAKDCDAIVAPDAGASKKAQTIADYYGKPLVQCLKTRKDGNITVQVLGDVEGKKLLVVDDICDGGGTFLALADAIIDLEPAELNLFVTHGIFSKGKEVLLNAYDNVETTNDWTV